MIAKTKTKKAKKTKTRKPTKSDLLSEAAELLERIEAQEEHCRDAAANVQRAREELQNAKAVYADAVTTLRRLCHARREEFPLLDQQKKPAAPANGESSPPQANGNPANVAPVSDGTAQGEFLSLEDQLAAESDADAQANDPSAWRVQHVSHLALPDKVAAKIEDAGYDTIGKLKELMDREGGWWWKSIKGLGETSAEKVSDAFPAFWRAHPDWAENAAA